MAKKYSEEERKAYCAKWRASGECKNKFCEGNRISRSMLYKWLKLYDKDSVKSEVKRLGLKFLEVEPVVSNRSSPVEITLVNGILIKTEVDSLRKLIQELSL